MKNKKVLAIFGNVALYGQERANIEVFDLLKSNGFDVTVLVNNRGFHWHLQPEFDSRNLKYEKVTFCWNFRFTRSLKAMLLYIIDPVKSNLEVYKKWKKLKPDYIHIANDFQYTLLLPFLLLIKTPIIFRLGDKPVTAYLFQKWAWKLICKRTNHFIFISNFIRKKACLISDVSYKCSLIYNVPTSRIITEQAVLKKETSYFYILYVGQISKDKGVDVLLNTVTKLIKTRNKVKLILAGNITNNKIFDQFTQEDTSEHITFLGQVKNVNYLYEICDIHIAPSVYEEPLSNVVGEAKLNGKASIVFDSGGLAELVTNNIDGYVCKEPTEEALEIEILKCIKNKNHLTNMHQNALLSIKTKKLTKDIFNKKWLTVYGV